MELVFFDLETGGLDSSRHAITQIAAVAVDAKSLIEFEAIEVKCKFKLENTDPEALKLNSYRPDAWEAEAVHPAEASKRIADFLSRHADVRMMSKKGSEYWVAQLAGHNAASFDGPFLQDWYKRLGVFLPASYRVLCTLQRAVWLFQERSDLQPPDNFKLATLCQYFNIQLDAAHDAAADCRATIELYRALINAQKCAPVTA